MKEYDLNVTATQIIRVSAESEEAAVQEAFHIAFGDGQESFADTIYELIATKEVE